MADTILEMRSITKTFPGVKALQNVNLDVRAGEIHAIVGENGAGKSTLMKVLSARASSLSTRSWRWCRSSRSPRTSTSATSSRRPG
jgi:ABC-type sugar transport system ATPase subunit